MNFGYKIVSRVTDTLYASWLKWPRAYYTVGKWTEPTEGCGPLCLFDTLSHAHNFALSSSSRTNQSKYRIDDDMVIFKCSGTISMTRHIWAPRTSNPVNGEDYNITPFTALPQGTVLVDSLILSKRME